MRHLRQVVRLKAEVVCHRPRLRRRIADELNVRRGAVLTRGADLVADRCEELHHKHRGHFVQLTVLAAWRDQRGPRAGTINITQRHEARIPRRRIGTRPNRMKCSLTQHASRNATRLPLLAVCARRRARTRESRLMESLRVKLAVNYRGRPPTGDLVATQLPHPATTHTLDPLMSLIVAPSRYAPIAAA